MSKNNTKMRKREIRKLWILNALLDCDQWSQKDIKKLWYLMSVSDLYGKKLDAIQGFNISESEKSEAWEKLLKKYKKYATADSLIIDAPENEEEKIKEEFKERVINSMLKKLDKNKKTFNDIAKQCSSDISNIIKELKNQGIINNEIITKKVAPKHARPIDSVYTLIENYGALYLILDEINNPRTPAEFKKLILNNLMDSEYLKRVVNEGLVEMVEKKHYLSLNKNDKQLLLFCLRRYSTVLYNTLKEINKPPVMINEDTPLIAICNPKKHTNGFILDVKNWAYNDMKSDNYSVDFEITVKIKDDEGKIIKHTNSSIIKDPIEEKHREMSGKAFLEAQGIVLNSDRNNDKTPIKQEETENDLLDYKDMVESNRKLMEMMDTRKKHRNNYFNNEIKDETIFIKDNGEKIDFQYLYIPSNVSPF
jgi:hypothetical protein